MNVLVTGGAGYIGSHCVIALLDAGYDVVIFDNFSTGHKETAEKLSEIQSKGKLLGTVEGDLLNMSDLDGLFNSYRIDAVIHFAAFSQVAESMRDPGKYYRNNVCGTLNLLDSMRGHGVGMIVFSSTAATYGEPEYTPIDEGHPQVPINPYGQTKFVIERIMDDYDKAYGLRSVRLRYFNVAGADSQCRVGEWHDPETHLIPNILKSTTDPGKSFSMFGTDYPTRDGTCIRDYVNVEDLADAHIKALEYLKKGGRTDFFNLGTNSGSSVREVFDSCEKILGTSIPLCVEGRRPGDPAILVADNKKAKEILGWEPKRDLVKSIGTAYEWEKKRQN
ncbi:MAG: UDP-glucose 4-epimerase GalE [Candidatus Methanomethylophilaceae archaeon]|nr:UDP-glucose 4-epimerase GalE [Candidatus Methanomethylophilaceae archaeon]